MGAGALDSVDLLIKLGRYADAEALARELLDDNPDNQSYYGRLAETMQIAPSTEHAVVRARRSVATM